ncbi:MAG TPA: hypothetical protein VIF64_10130 [Pyrinomonadaceae bacterium]|jgi:hypothetical protein
MKRVFKIVFVLITLSISALGHPMRAGYAATAADLQQDDEAARNRTREQLAKLLEKVGPTINVTFNQSQKQPYNYVGSLKTGLVNAESFEIVISVTPKETIGFRIYPHYKNGYINVDKANNRAALMRLLLRLSDRAFLFWGADEAGDIFTGYTFTLESGFPEEAIKVVLRSIVNSDKFVGEMRPILDGPVQR